MLRFAPSPTKDMDIGSLRVALFNFILSKQLKEDLLIRIDDLEKEKIIEGKDKEILELLSLFSIDYKGVVYQSDNLKYHQKMAMQLMSQKKAFACFCSEDKLQEIKEEAQKEGKVPSYDGFCSTLSDETVLNCNAPFTVRIKQPEQAIAFCDILQGEKVSTQEEVDSFVILNHDKSPTYNYACAVDDMLYNTTTIVRTQNYLTDTPKQMHVRESLGYATTINTIHLPTILSSNEQANSVKWLIDEGFLPSAIANYLILIGNETPQEIFTLEEAIEWLDISKTSKEPIEFDLNVLKQINKTHLESMEEMRLSKILGFADTDIGKLAKLYLAEVYTIKEIKEKLNLIFSKKEPKADFKEAFNALQSAIKNAPYFEQYEDFKNYLIENTNLDQNTLMKPLQYIITGQEEGIKVDSLYPYLKNYLGEIV